MLVSFQVCKRDFKYFFLKPLTQFTSSTPFQFGILPYLMHYQIKLNKVRLCLKKNITKQSELVLSKNRIILVQASSSCKTGKWLEVKSLERSKIHTVIIKLSSNLINWFSEFYLMVLQNFGMSYNNIAALGKHIMLLTSSSFEAVDEYVEQYLPYTPEKWMLVLWGTHSDLEQQRQVSSGEALSKAEQHGMMLFETSAKLGTNIEYMFETLMKMFLEFPNTGLVLKTQRKTADTESKWW